MKSLALLVFFFLGISRVFADGAYRHQHLIEPAQIPRQSAAISFADGKETLTIWNTVEAKGQDLAWVLPLPAKPEIIRPSHPNAFKILRLLTAPPVMVSRVDGVAIAAVLLLGLSLMRGKRLRRAWLIPALIICLVAYAAIMVPFASGIFAGAAGKGGQAKDVEVLSAQNVGNYETTVISGSTAEAVNDWLRSEGFPVFTGGDALVLESYVAKQWVFLCSRLKTTASGPSAGHPLSVRFPVEKPVYPMSLTKSAGSVPLEIFWMGEPVRDPSGRLAVLGVTNDVSRSYFHRLRAYVSEVLLVQATGGSANSANIPGSIADKSHDLLLDQILQEQEVIQFTATFNSSGDWSDLDFDPAEKMPEIESHATRGWIIERALHGVAPIVTGLFLLLGLAAQLCGKPGQRPHITWAAAGLVLLLSAAGVAWNQVPRGVVIVESSRVRPPLGDGPDSPYEWAREWIDSLKGTKPPQ